jgi:glycosyltransferase involved in cell wall biosynthesis
MGNPALSAADPTTIGFISEPGGLGGGEISLLTLLEHLPEGYHPTLLTYADGPLVDRCREMGIPTKVIHRGGVMSLPRVARQSADWLRETNATLVHVNTLDIRGGLAARIAGLPLVGHLRVIMPFTWIDRLFVRMSNRVISVSDAAGAKLSRGRRSISSKLQVIPNAVAPPGSDRSLRAELGLAETDLLVGGIGRFDPVKGFEYLIEAIGRARTTHPNLHLVLIGAPGEDQDQQEYAAMLDREVHRQGLSDTVTFTGFRPNAAALLAGLDIMAVPSIPRETESGIWEEGFGRVAAEGMSASIPVIVSQSGGLAEIIEEGVTGKVVPPADSDALSDAICELAISPEKRKRLGQEGRQTFLQRYTVEHHVDQVTRLYATLLGKVG